ncbi:putative DnaJ/Hsp40 [Cafeteria roenbergensis virus]|uniref:Putative DnaJ/Hsp40 n=1 Tax=Cafeteria roenbergensis virus (strain BV-PW1) TaxID=693272 RepID=E3T4Y0_CROVB|nr:putative DnaJ/Hsp40 [Cafeteria roenbergensis virus BV-PW1]ADO67243.1 putative DnaJ/Hsp40 [Cafeteria roenbergensis virus BV-PW1]
MKDYYKILGISKNAGFIDVINSYNESISFFNKKQLNDIDKQTIKEIKEAYFILGNYHNRRSYDNNLDGYKKVNDNFTDRIFFRPNLEQNYTKDNQLRNTVSDIMNNKKNRLDKHQNFSFFDE